MGCGGSVFTAPGTQAHFRLALISISDVCLLEMLTAQDPFLQVAATFRFIVKSCEQQAESLECFHPSTFTRPSFPFYGRVWKRDYSLSPMAYS